MTTQISLGDILIQDKLINQAQLEQALARQKEKRETGDFSLGKILVELKFVTEQDVVEARGRQLGIPFIILDNYLIEPVIAQIIGEVFSRENSVIAINQVGAKLTVAMEDPSNTALINAIELTTGLTVKPVIASATDIEEALDKVFGAPGSKPASAEAPSKDPIIAKLDQLIELICGEAGIEDLAGDISAMKLRIVERRITHLLTQLCDVARVSNEIKEPKDLGGKMKLLEHLTFLDEKYVQPLLAALEKVVKVFSAQEAPTADASAPAAEEAATTDTSATPPAEPPQEVTPSATGITGAPVTEVPPTGEATSADVGEGSKGNRANLQIGGPFPDVV